MRRVIVIGLDGATFDILSPLMDKDELPYLKHLAETGVHGKLRTVIPPGTGPAWSSIATGLDPSSHGVFDLIVRAEDSYDLAFLNASSLRAATVWDLVGSFGGKVLVLNVPMTFPPRRVNGFMVSGLLTPLGSNRCTYPADLLETLRQIDPGYRIVPTQTYAPGRIKAFLDDLERVFDSKVAVMKELMRRTDWQFVMQVFNETDFLQHALWHVIDPEHPRHDRQEHEGFARRIADFYRRIDSAIADIVEAAGEDASVVILSDHGHGPLHEFIHANNLFLKEGVMRVRRDPRSWIKHALFRLGFTPLSVYRAGNALGLGKLRMGLRWTSKGYGMLSRFFFSFSDIDWKRSVGYAISGGVYGGVFVNLRGREPRGAVDSHQYEEVRTRLGKVLSGLRHPEDGKPLVAEILKREDVYSGRFTQEAPDLLFLPRDPTVGVFGDFEFSSNRIVEPASEAISAQHRMDGVFFAGGPEVRSGVEVTGMRVVDVAPVLLYLMGFPIPDGLDGNLRQDLFLEDVVRKRPPSYFDLDQVLTTPEGGRKSMEDESIKQRLKGLGYIS